MIEISSVSQVVHNPPDFFCGVVCFKNRQLYAA